MKDSTLKLIFEQCHGIAINMNDTFYYACADFETIDSYELEDLEPVIEKYGNEAFKAYTAIKRGHDPQIPQNVTENYKNAKQMIQEIIDKVDEYGPFYELRDSIKMKPYTPNERKKISKKISRLKDWFSFFLHR